MTDLHDSDRELRVVDPKLEDEPRRLSPEILL
jgi:hypothetical protein